MSRERIEKQLRKTGNTEFEFSFLKAEIGEKVFLPMQSLNELRREALETLEKVICEKYRRSGEVKIRKKIRQSFQWKKRYFPDGRHR